MDQESARFIFGITGDNSPEDLRRASDIIDALSAFVLWMVDHGELNNMKKIQKKDRRAFLEETAEEWLFG